MENNKPVVFAELTTFLRNQSKLNQPLFGSINETSRLKSNLFETRKKNLSSKSKKYMKKIQVQKIRKEKVTRLVNEAANRCCIYCKKNDHELLHCYFFRKLNQDKEVEFIKKFGLCFACLTKGHTSKERGNRLACNICKRKHPTILHVDFENKDPNLS